MPMMDDVVILDMDENVSTCIYSVEQLLCALRGLF